MFPAKRGTSAGFTMPFCMISANPEMEVRGVFSSFSRSSRSVMSRITTTAPTTSPSRRTGLPSTWQQRPFSRSSCWLRLPERAPSTTLRKLALRFRVRALSRPPAWASGQPSSRRALVL